MAGRFPLLVDEHVPWSLVQALRRRGWIVVRVVDLEPELGEGSNDERVFSYAFEQGYVVLSSDERALWRPKRYREQGKPFLGMLCWPQRHRDRMSIGDALGDIARAKGIAQIARDTGFGRASLYKALSPEGNPELATVLKVVRALGLQLHAAPAHS